MEKPPRKISFAAHAKRLIRNDNKSSPLLKFRRETFRCAKLYYTEETVPIEFIEKIQNWYERGVDITKIAMMLGGRKVFSLKIVDVYATLYFLNRAGKVEQRDVTSPAARHNRHELRLVDFAKLVRAWRQGISPSNIVKLLSDDVEVSVMKALIVGLNSRARESYIERRFIQECVLADATEEIRHTTSSFIFNDDRSVGFFTGDGPFQLETDIQIGVQPEVSEEIQHDPVIDVHQPPRKAVDEEITIDEMRVIEDIVADEQHVHDKTDPDCADMPGEVISDDAKVEIFKNLFD